MSRIQVSSKARRYGRSLARVALERGTEAVVHEELHGLSEFFGAMPTARLVLASRASSHERQGALLKAIGDAVPGLSATTRNYLALLVDARRFDLFEQTVAAFEQEVAKAKGRLEVEVVTAEPMQDAQRTALTATLSRTVAKGKQLDLKERIDPAILGGVVTRIGSVVFDGSVQNQLEQLRQQLISE